MAERLVVTKTYKLYIGGSFPRTESGRSTAVEGGDGEILAYVCRASKKDLRDAVEAARGAQPRWAAASAYNRGQVLYRMAEMLEGKREEFVQANSIPTGRRGARTRSGRSSGLREVDASIDRLVSFAGWADKIAQVLGCQNPVAGPYYTFTVPEPTGVVGIVAPDEPALLGLVSLIAPAICCGNAVVVVAGEANPLPAAILGEVCATSDVPGGVINVVTGRRDELIPHLAEHREINAIAAANVGRAHAKTLQLGAAENIKRVHVFTRRADDWLDEEAMHSPSTIEPYLEMKTIWHPSAT